MGPWGEDSVWVFQEVREELCSRISAPNDSTWQVGGIGTTVVSPYFSEGKHAHGGPIGHSLGGKSDRANKNYTTCPKE